MGATRGVSLEKPGSAKSGKKRLRRDADAKRKPEVGRRRWQSPPEFSLFLPLSHIIPPSLSSEKEQLNQRNQTATKKKKEKEREREEKGERERRVSEAITIRSRI